jgi:hypothetical protein
MAERLPSGHIELNFPADDLVEIPNDAVGFEPCAEAVDEALRGKATLKRVVHGRLDVLLEIELNDGVNLAELDVKQTAFVRLAPNT